MSDNYILEKKAAMGIAEDLSEKNDGVNLSVDEVHQKYIKIKWDRIEIDKNFAEKNLSIFALRECSLVSDQCYSWAKSGIYAVLYFELPTVFPANFVEFMDMLAVEAPNYMECHSENISTLWDIYIKNKKKVFQV